MVRSKCFSIEYVQRLLLPYVIASSSLPWAWRISPLLLQLFATSLHAWMVRQVQFKVPLRKFPTPFWTVPLLLLPPLYCLDSSAHNSHVVVGIPATRSSTGEGWHHIIFYWRFLHCIGLFNSFAWICLLQGSALSFVWKAESRVQWIIRGPRSHIDCFLCLELQVLPAFLDCLVGVVDFAILSGFFGASSSAMMDLRLDGGTTGGGRSSSSSSSKPSKSPPLGK